MSIKEFAAVHRLRTVTDEDKTTIIPGRTGQIYDHGDGMQFGVLFQPDTDKFRTREAWNNRRRQCESVGMILHQSGDYEGSLLFDPANPLQAKLAIKVAGVAVKRKVSATHLEILKRGRAALQRRKATLSGKPSQTTERVRKAKVGV